MSVIKVPARSVLEEDQIVSAKLQLNDIEKSYGSVKALKGVSLEIADGKTVALVGVNGAGKTSLLRILAGLERQDRGAVFYEGRKANEKELRQIATMVFQKTAMFSRSVFDNLAYGLRIRGRKDAEVREQIARELQAVGLRNFDKRKARKTSGGEQQRISLARAFLLSPQILLLDEPTANLDPNSATIIERAIASRSKEREIVILATHNLGQARRLADEIVHIHDGRIVEIANPDEFFENPKCEISRKFTNGELEY